MFSTLRSRVHTGENVAAEQPPLSPLGQGGRATAFKFVQLVAFLAVWAGTVPACAGEKEHHEHKSPHGGALVALGEHAAHLEFVLDAKSGKLTAYVLDGEAEKPVRLKQKEIEVNIVDAASKKSLDLKLKGLANALTGEKEGDTSEFSLQHDGLKGVSKFEGTVKELSVKGKEWKAVKFKFPEGHEGH